VSRAISVSWLEAEELLWRTAFRVLALRLRALASLPPALERRRIAHPKLRITLIFKVRLQQGFSAGEMGVQGSDCRAQFQAADVRFGSKADIEACLRDVRFTPEIRHRLGALGSAGFEIHSSRS